MSVGDFRVPVYDHYVASDQVRAYCAFGHEQRVFARFARDRNRAEHPGGKRAVGVVEIGAHGKGCRFGAYLVVEIVENARANFVGIFEESQLDFRPRPSVDVYLFEKSRVAVVYHVAFAQFEIRLNCVVFYDGRKHRRVRDDEVTDVDEFFADSARNGGADVREIEVELRVAQNRLRAQQRGVCRKHFAVAGVENFLRNDVGGEKFLGAL